MAIDEAQMVEANNTKLAEMCLRISAVHRWCVTGTPFKRGMEGQWFNLLQLLIAKKVINDPKILTTSYFAPVHDSFFQKFQRQNLGNPIKNQTH